MSNKPRTPSIRSIAIQTVGGTPARKGFNLQDHVAASYCIRMMSDEQLKEIWCETHDDITLIWQRRQGEEVEFVQVKSEEPNQLWSIARLCLQDSASKKKDGTSIFERSLAHHCCSEPCWFRIATSRDVMEELKSLTLLINSPERTGARALLDGLALQIEKKLGGFKSPNGEGCSFWVSRTHREVVQGVESVEPRNIVALTRELERIGGGLVIDQITELYRKLVRLAYDAGLTPSAEAKKLKRPEVLSWITRTAEALAHPASISGTRLANKMKAAKLPPDAVDSARETRWLYRQRVLVDPYSSPSDYKLVRGEVVASLNSLRARLDSGDILDDGPAFHARCLGKLDDIYSSQPSAKKLGLAFLQGCMYDVTDRCGHRFLRVSA